MRIIKDEQGWLGLGSPKSQGDTPWSLSQEQHSLGNVVAHMGRRETRAGKWEAGTQPSPPLTSVIPSPQQIWLMRGRKGPRRGRMLLFLIQEKEAQWAGR